jgi:hypothetical protein
MWLSECSELGALSILDKGVDVWSLAGTKVQSMDTSSKWASGVSVEKRTDASQGGYRRKDLARDQHSNRMALKSQGDGLSTSDLDENTPERGQVTNIHEVMMASRAVGQATIRGGQGA